MKKKFIILTLCFSIIFSSLNYKKSYADGGVISLPFLATVSALAVGTGIIINGNDDLYDLGRMFYDYIDRHNDLTWDTVKTVFSSSVALQPNKLVSVDSKFLDIVKDFFDNTFNFDSNVSNVSTVLGFPVLMSTSSFSSIENRYNELDNFGFRLDTSSIVDGSSYVIGSLKVVASSDNLYFYVNNARLGTFYNYSATLFLDLFVCDYKGYTLFGGYKLNSSNRKSVINIGKFSSLSSSSVVSFPYNGGYSWDNVESKKENESVSLPIPGNLGQLVGQGNSDFWGNTDNLVGNGDLSIPSVDNPSVGIDGSVSFPGVSSPDVPGVDSPSVPNEGIWATIKDFIIGLVVPSDTYWTDTWGGLYNNFTSSFPMVDMDGFNDLVTGEKKFPNIDINIMGVNGRVVNGDVINSIVDWLRPIIAGFMMLCLMLFNYRKIYKLIRNSEPFGGIAPGTSDFNTGISEYSKQDVVKATDMVAEYRAWKERGGK